MTSKNAWEKIAGDFRVLRARDVLAATTLLRHQDLRAHIKWLSPDEPPLALLFISHRWETLAHPDPGGQQLRAIQKFLLRLADAIEALLVPKEARLRLIPSLTIEGALQAEEIARRMLDFSTFSDETAAAPPRETKSFLVQQYRSINGDGAAFRALLFDKVGVWSG